MLWLALRSALLHCVGFLLIHRQDSCVLDAGEALLQQLLQASSGKLSSLSDSQLVGAAEALAMLSPSSLPMESSVGSEWRQVRTKKEDIACVHPSDRSCCFFSRQTTAFKALFSST